MNLNDLYRPIGRLYEEVPSANYFGDYSAANGGWNNAIEDNSAVKAMNDEIAALVKQKELYQTELNDLITGTATCEYQATNLITGAQRGYQCKNLKVQYGTRKNTSKPFKDWTFVAYDLWTSFETTIKNTLPNAIASVEKQIKEKQGVLELQISLKGQSTQSSQETTTETLKLKAAQEKAEAEKAKAKAEAESKQKQTDAELRAKKIFLSIMASGLVLAAAGYAIFRR